ncbi:hypothetical protein ACFSM5_11185 [Lacibacterium aquatile]|uniref:Uncharacterized protein n=1 Tax=Lacibacterium aquatile TaxID=1168082 RepID=A0ABW5DQQ8_9PROT
MSEKRFVLINTEGSTVLGIELLILIVGGAAVAYDTFRHGAAPLVAAVVIFGVLRVIYSQPVLRKIWQFASCLAWGYVGYRLGQWAGGDIISKLVGAAIGAFVAFAAHARTQYLEDNVERIG